MYKGREVGGKSCAPREEKVAGQNKRNEGRIPLGFSLVNVFSQAPKKEKYVRVAVVIHGGVVLPHGNGITLGCFVYSGLGKEMNCDRNWGAWVELHQYGKKPIR